MQFKRINTWYSVSDQGYTVSAAKVNGAFIFTAWPPKNPNQKTTAALLYSNNANACYAACKQHYQQHNPKAAA